LGKKSTIAFESITVIAVLMAINQQAPALTQNQTYDPIRATYDKIAWIG